MATYTPNLNLKKPTGNEYYDVVAEDNDAKDKIDLAIGNHASQLAETMKKTTGRVSISKWESLVIDKGLSTEDWKNAFQAAIDYLKGQSYPDELIFPQGVYKYSVSPNWSLRYAKIRAEGVVKLRYTGVEHAVIIDSGVSAVTNMYMGEFIVEAPSTAKNGVKVVGCHHSKFDFIIQGCGADYAGYDETFCVCTEHNIKVTPNSRFPVGWYLNAKPKYGIKINKRNAGEPCTYGIFYNPIVENCVNGIWIEDGVGNMFLGGTPEECDNYGLYISPTSSKNTLYNSDFEVNGGSDIHCLGNYNILNSVNNLDGVIVFDGTAKGNVVNGGNIHDVILAATSSGNIITNVRYDGALTDNGVNNRFTDNFNKTSNRQENRPKEDFLPQTITASPFDYKNTSGNDEQLIIRGGTISSVIFWDNSAKSIDITGFTNSFIKLKPNDKVGITYTVAPAVYRFRS